MRDAEHAGVVWLTRTQPEGGGALAAALEEAGWTVLPLPVLQIEPLALDAAAMADLQRHIPMADYIVWTSAHAVGAVPATWFANCPPEALHAVGARTAQAAARHLGRSVYHPQNGHGGMAWINDIRNRWRAGQRVLVLTGVDGRSDWHTAIRDAGLMLTVVPLYRRRPRLVTLPPQDPVAVIATSGAALQAMLDCRPSVAARHRPLLLPAARLTAEARRGLWSGRILPMPDLSPAAVLTALESCR
ncbi:MAG: uroporphyrinogen-III synthase [Oceanococcaceae bacterium]